MNKILAKVKKSELIYPKENKDGTLQNVPFYKTTFVFKDNNKNLEFTFCNEYTYFDKNTKVEAFYDGKNIFINELQHQIPFPVNTFIRFGRKHPLGTLLFFISTIIWIIVFALKHSLTAVLPVSIFFSITGFLNFMNYFKLKDGIIIESIVKDIIRKKESFNTIGSNSYYLYEYNYENKPLLHVSFYSGANKKNKGKKVNLIYNKDANLIIERKKLKYLLLFGIFKIFVGLLMFLIIFNI